jgi:hypothetical protein
MKHFAKALLEVTEQASADTVEMLKTILDQGNAAAAYTRVALEVHALSVALDATATPKRFAGRSGSRPRPPKTVELRGMTLSMDQAQRRMEILRIMQQAAFEDVLDDEEAKSLASTAIPVPDTTKKTSDVEQQAFPWDPSTTDEEATEKKSKP